MQQKTQVNAEDGKQELHITREFDLPLESLFEAYVEPEFLEQWMGTKVIKLEGKKHGGWQFETSDPNGNVVFRAHGTIHEFVPNEKITRTFEMLDAEGFGVQLEFLEFRKLTDDTSRLDIHIVYRSVAERDQYLKIGMTQGMNMAHNRLQNIARKTR